MTDEWREIDEYGYPMLYCGDILEVGKKPFRNGVPNPIRVVCKDYPNCEHKSDRNSYILVSNRLDNSINRSSNTE